MLRVLDIVEGTTVDGPGLRTTIYFAGCSHHCPECHNPQSWDFSGGREMTVEQIMDVIIENDFDVTFSGGDPLQQPLNELTQLASEVKKIGKTLWVYTGFLFEEIATEKKYRPLLELTDIVVDGPFVSALRDISLHFRGSSNQRIIEVVEALKEFRC